MVDPTSYTKGATSFLSFAQLRFYWVSACIPTTRRNFSFAGYS